MSGVKRFDEARRRLGALTRLPPHVEPIAVRCVVGSADAAKAASLRRNFLPRRHGAQSSRYQAVERAMHAGTPLPAIEVYKLGGAYYVVDGHHRVAAARALGQLYLDALVHEFPLAGSGPTDQVGGRGHTRRLRLGRDACGVAALPRRLTDR